MKFKDLLNEAGVMTTQVIDHDETKKSSNEVKRVLKKLKLKIDNVMPDDSGVKIFILGDHVSKLKANLKGNFDVSSFKNF